MTNRAWHKEKGSAAHHIVAGDDVRAKQARDILSKYNIDINSAEMVFTLNILILIASNQEHIIE